MTGKKGDDLSNPTKRVTLFRVNKFQKVYFIPVMLAFASGCAVSWLSLVYFFIDVFPLSPALERFKSAIPALLSVAAILMIAVIFWTCRLTNRYLGSHERVIREIDEVLAGHTKAVLRVRRSDSIFAELLKRINALIQKIP